MHVSNCLLNVFTWFSSRQWKRKCQVLRFFNSFPNLQPTSPTVWSISLRVMWFFSTARLKPWNYPLFQCILLRYNLHAAVHLNLRRTVQSAFTNVSASPSCQGRTFLSHSKCLVFLPRHVYLLDPSAEATTVLIFIVKCELCLLQISCVRSSLGCSFLSLSATFVRFVCLSVVSSFPVYFFNKYARSCFFHSLKWFFTDFFLWHL